MVRDAARAGFTFIELLVSVAILMILMGGGIAAYLNFSDKQKVVQSGADVAFLARAAQKKARVGDKPAGCTRLNAYEFQIPSNGVIVLRAVCTNATVETQRLTLPSGVTITGGSTVQFFVLHGGASSNQTIVVSGGGTTYTFTIGTGGDISEGVVQ